MARFTNLLSCFLPLNMPLTLSTDFQAVRMFFSLSWVTIIIYIDDILVLADTTDECIRVAQFLIDTLINLGFHIKREKCVLQPFISSS